MYGCKNKSHSQCQLDPYKKLIIKINNGFVDFNGNIVGIMNPHYTLDFEKHYHNVEFVDKTCFKIFKSNGDLFTANNSNSEGVWTYISKKLYSTNKYNLSSQFNSVSTSLCDKNIVYFLNYGEDAVLNAISERRDNTEVLNLINSSYNTFSISVNNHGYSALMLASSYVVVEKLLEHGIDKNYLKDKKTSALKSARDGYSHTYTKFKVLYNHNVDINPKEGLLHAACKWNKTRTIYYLVMNKIVYVNDINENMETPLIIAAKFCNVEAVKLLLTMKASKSYQDIYGKTALDYAFEQNQFKICRLLSKNNPIKRLYYYISSKKLPLVKQKRGSAISVNMEHRSHTFNISYKGIIK
jgi:ankyrin repeat protein